MSMHPIQSVFSLAVGLPPGGYILLFRINVGRIVDSFIDY